MLPQWTRQKVQRSILCAGRQIISNSGQPSFNGQWYTLSWLAIRLNLISVQGNITAAFIHARVPVTETIYVHQPRSFHRGNGDEVLCLKRTLYGLKQSPGYFFACITECLIKQGLTASKFDPCLFMSGSLIAIVYVGDILIYGQSDAKIDNLIEC